MHAGERDRGQQRVGQGFPHEDAQVAEPFDAREQDVVLHHDFLQRGLEHPRDHRDQRQRERNGGERKVGEQLARKAELPFGDGLEQVELGGEHRRAHRVDAPRDREQRQQHRESEDQQQRPEELGDRERN